MLNFDFWLKQVFSLIKTNIVSEPAARRWSLLNVLKTGRRPVIIPVRSQRGWARIEPAEPEIGPPNRTNRPTQFFFLFFFFFPPSIRAAVPMFAGHWSVVPLAAAPARWKALPQNAAKPRRRPLNPSSLMAVPIVANNVWNIEIFWRYFSKIMELGFMKFKSIGIKVKKPLE